MKYDWKKQDRDLYGVKTEPQIIDVPKQNYIMIDGQGNPNDADFSERVGVIYSLAHPVKMRFKAMCKNDSGLQEMFEYSEYTIFPLEGIWSTANPDDLTDKDNFIYTIMIRQPDWITREMFESAYEAVAQKKPHPYLKEARFDSCEDGKCIQMRHKGSFDDEPASFAAMEAFAREHSLERASYIHREIYLNDARKTAPEKRSTILRFQVKGE